MNLKNQTRVNEQPAVHPQEHITILSLEIKEREMTANLSDSRSIIIPTAWFKRLRNATLQQLKQYEISPAGCAIHWEELNEDISIKSFINGLKGGCCH